MSFQKKIGHCRQIVLCLCVPVKISSVLCALNTNSFWIVYACLSESDRSSYSVYMHHKKLVFIYKWLFQHDLIELFRDSRFKSFLCLLLQNANITAIFTKHFTIALAQQWSLEVTYRMHVWFNNPLNEASDICNIFSTRNEFSVQSVRLSTQNQAQTTYGKCIYIWW